jgi:hypothetical protein
VAAADHALACPMHIHLFEPPCSIPLTVSTMSVSIDETIPSDAKPLAVPPINDPFHPKFHERQSQCVTKPSDWSNESLGLGSSRPRTATRGLNHRARGGHAEWACGSVSGCRPCALGLLLSSKTSGGPSGLSRAPMPCDFPFLLQREPRVVRADVAGRLGARRSEPLVWRLSALLVASGTRCLPRLDGRGVGRAAPGFCDLGG